MTPREIIAESWAITTRERALKRWGFASALFETLRSVELLLYQAYFLYWYYKGVSVGWLSVEVLFFQSMPFGLFVAVTMLLIVLLVLELVIPTMATGAVIGLAAKAYRKEAVKGGLVLALYNFLPLVEVHGMFLLSHFATVFTIGSIVLRYGGDSGIKAVAFTMLGLLWIFATFFRFFASFSEEGVVIRKVGVFSAIGRSFKLIISYLSHVMFLLILLFVISIRIFINAIMVFLTPAIAIGIGLLLAMVLPVALSIIIAVGIGMMLLLLFSYLIAYLHVFQQTVWTLTYLELSARKDLDVIEG